MSRLLKKSIFRPSIILSFFSGVFLTSFVLVRWDTNPSNNIKDSPKEDRYEPLVISYRQLANFMAGQHSDPVHLIHQSWKTRHLPKRFSNWTQTWHECFPEWTHILWTDADNENFVAEQYPWFLERYRSFKRQICRVDSVRYLYLHHFGGLYTCAHNCGYKI